LGALPGETRTWEFTFPPDYPVELWRGETAVATVKVIELFSYILPEVRLGVGGCGRWGRESVKSRLPSCWVAGCCCHRVCVVWLLATTLGATHHLSAAPADLKAHTLDLHSRLLP
jgi:hypothetical protein